MQVKGLLFDAYGTLFDVHSVIEAGGAVTSDPQTLSNLWRSKQLEYTWLLSLMGRYGDFWAVTEAALVFACRRLRLEVSAAQRARLMEAYLGWTRSRTSVPSSRGSAPSRARSSRTARHECWRPPWRTRRSASTSRR